MSIINFLQEVNKLKDIKRTGWVVKKVENPESVADHTFRVALMAYLLCPENFDKDKMIKMALINELTEARTGDIVTKHTDSEDFKNNKLEKEKQVIREMVKDIDNDEIVALFDESEELKTEEAKFLKQLDKLEMAFQALEYEKINNNQEEFDEFWETTRTTLQHPKLIEIFEELEKQR